MSSDTAATKRFNTYIEFTKRDSVLGMTFVPLEEDSAWIVVFADPSFASFANTKSQLGLVTCYIDKKPGR